MRALIFCSVLIFSIISCKNTAVDDIICSEDCLFTYIQKKGTVSFTNCYDQWSITFDDDGIRAIIVDPKNELKVEGLRVEVDANFFDNDFPFLMPDPPGPINYKIEIKRYKILD